MSLLHSRLCLGPSPLFTWALPRLTFLSTASPAPGPPENHTSVYLQLSPQAPGTRRDTSQSRHRRSSASKPLLFQFPGMGKDTPSLLSPISQKPSVMPVTAWSLNPKVHHQALAILIPKYVPNPPISPRFLYPHPHYSHLFARSVQYLPDGLVAPHPAPLEAYVPFSTVLPE